MLLNTKHTIGTIAYMGGIPAVLEEFCWSWSQMIQYNGDYLCEPNERIFYTRAKVSDHAFARDNLVKGMEGDWILMLDTDHQFEPDLAARLVHEFEKNDLDILTGLYCYKRDPYPPVVFLRNKANGLLQPLGAWDAPLDGGGGRYLVPIAGAGGGCLLVRRRVFERITNELDESPFGHRKGLSEDHSFFDRCHQLGIQAFACPQIESPHLTTRAIRLADYHYVPSMLSERMPTEALR